MKKDVAILFGITADHSFALANVLEGLKDHSPDLADDIIVQHECLPAEEQARLSAILPCIFKRYEPPVELPNHRLTALSFSRFEALGMLSEYRHVLWLDVDLLIRGDVSEVLDYADSGIAACWEPGLLESLFPEPIGHLDDFSRCDFSTPYFNTGVLLFSDAIENPTEKMEWLYAMAERHPQACLKSADMTLINLMTQVFELQVQSLPETFNSMICEDWHLAYQPKCDTRVVHSITENKFWNYWFFREWEMRYRRWIEAGGTPACGYVSPLRRPWWRYLARKIRVYKKRTSRFRRSLQWPRGRVR